MLFRDEKEKFSVNSKFSSTIRIPEENDRIKMHLLNFIYNFTDKFLRRFYSETHFKKFGEYITRR